MYRSYPSLVLGFHGCEKEIGMSLLLGEKEIKASNNKYDWLGSGMYFWENNPSRALNYAQEIKTNTNMGKVQEPFVIGAVLDLGNCFNLLDHKNLEILKANYQYLVALHETQNIPLPKNDLGANHLLRFLDRAVIEFAHENIRSDSEIQEFDSVRAVFIEGEKLYPNAGFNEKNHIQICIRNPNCIKGFFLPRSLKTDYSRV